MPYFFKKTIYKKQIVFTINDSVIKDTTVNSILSCKINSKKIGINMKNVKCINSKKFIKCLIENNFKLYNLNSEVLAYLAIVLKDGFLKSHMSLEDLSENKRELVKRHFLVA